MQGLELSEYINKVSEEISERVAHERNILLKFLDQDNHKPVDYCPLVDCEPKKKYREALWEAVRVIEETRRSFKSRQLEELRKRLQAVLAEDSQ